MVPLQVIAVQLAPVQIRSGDPRSSGMLWDPRIQENLRNKLLPFYEIQLYRAHTRP